MPIILARFQSKFNFIDKSRKNAQISNFMKICLVAAGQREMVRTDMLKLLIAFRNFAKAPNKKKHPRYLY